MRAWEISSEFGLSNLRLVELPEPTPTAGQVKLRMLAASINYRDLVVVEGAYGRAVKAPVIPMSDGVGEVIDVGPEVTRFRVGDRVCPTFFPDWLHGEPREEVMRLDSGLGASRAGTLCEVMVVNEQSAVRVPDYLTNEEAATLPCAGLTAWNALTYGRQVRPGDLVLIQGTGGVSTFALQFAKLMGARVIVTSSSDEKLGRAKELGADETLNYRTFPEWHQEVKKNHAGGVDRIIEVGGADTLARSLKCVRVGGVLAMVGVLSGAKPPLDLPLVVMRFVRLEGITVGSREHFEAMLRALDQSKLRPCVEVVIPFKEAPSAFERVKAGGTFGKICVRM